MSDGDADAFEQGNLRQGVAMARDQALLDAARRVAVDADRYDWSYQWTWLGVPVIQMPPDIVALQEILWACRPQVVIETGVARGGSLILSASILQLLGEGTVVGIDVDIRPHNREAIESHPLAPRIKLIEGSSIDPSVVQAVASEASGAERVMVILDSDHTHDHVLAELRAYGGLVTPGQFLIVADTGIEYIPPQSHRPRAWHPGNSPASALTSYLGETNRFEPALDVMNKLLITASPGGYLRCARG